MGLGEFVALDWNCKMGTVPECREFILNSTNKYTTTLRCMIDLSEVSLAMIFKLGEANTREASLRARQWQSQKFIGAKDKNRYKLSQCTNPTLVERLEFMRTAWYMQEKKAMVSGSLVREVEEVLGSSTNWAKHFHKQFHHELSMARLTKKTLLGSHIRMIFHWVKQ
ncbi:unnamed protein product [Calypogeia fissa]